MEENGKNLHLGRKIWIWEGLGEMKGWEEKRLWGGRWENMGPERARNGMREGWGEGKGWQDKRTKWMEGKKQM